jgi:hypothetical protein
MTTTLDAAPRIRIRPAPACDPPFEDEADPDQWTTLAAPSLLDAPPPTRRRPQPRPAAEPPQVGPSPQTRLAVSRFLNTCLEILNGYRPASHVRAISDPAMAATVVQAMTGALRRVSVATRAGTCRVTIRRVRVCEPRAGVAEISAVLGTRHEPGSGGAVPVDGQCWAAAFRLEQRGGRWLCHVAHLL